ncbi:hypothetical protein [Kribbella sp. NPDC048915]|uniref:hypothetical protein n=1 Tax=Kribbella sp. NPDC048915 TaxID=3155148 RepID=UPI0033F587AE
MTEPMIEALEPSALTVEQARRFGRDMLAVVSGAAAAAVEHFAALCEYLDDLYGGDGFDRLLRPVDRVEVAALVRRLRREAPTGSPVLDDDHRPVELNDPDADEYFDTVIRFEQPVNSSLTLPQGRVLADELARQDGWAAEIGRLLQGLYRYLDELHGGPGAFTEMLNSEDVLTVRKARLADRRP